MQTSLRSLLRRTRAPKPASAFPKAIGEAKPLHLRNSTVFQGDSSPEKQSEMAVPASIREARLNAVVDVLPSRPFRKGHENSLTARPLGRAVPFGFKDRKQKGQYIESISLNELDEIGASAKPKPLKRARPAFRSPVRIQEAAASLEVSLPAETAPVESGSVKTDSTRRLKPSFRRYSCTSSLLRSLAPEAATDRYSGGNSQQEMSDEQIRQHSENIQHNTVFSSRVPLNKGDLVGILRRSAGRQQTLKNLRDLQEFQRRHHHLATTASYNILLQLAFVLRDLRTFNELLATMKAVQIPRDAVTWDLSMTTWAGNARWDRLVEEFEERKRDGIPLTMIGWTRLLQAATRNGTTNISEEERHNTMNPIYRALYALPKGVKQLQIRQLMHSPRMDVDQLLTAMMPRDLHQLDYQATIVVMHRLAKQRRWREADDIAALWLEAAAHEHSLNITASEAAGEERIDGTMSDRSVALAHIVLEGLVVSRASYEVVREYLDDFIQRYAHFSPKPTYHTLFLWLTSFRILPIKIGFFQATKAFEDFQLEHDLRPITAGDVYGHSRCRRQLQEYGIWTLRAYRRAQKQSALRKAVELKMSDLQLDSDVQDAAWDGVDAYTEKNVRMPPQHTLYKEKMRHEMLRLRFRQMQVRLDKAGRGQESEHQTAEDIAKEQVE
ncbi:MAG: hypothetical protein CYPHOPRED_002799 [Cyphobasidiales sp. Tagirdzhanova-0007]|nr:MAG: hypothetical protein CYPHOPRED_002799 [Cyphobasidiales sp. Tagirdzhanova-0007]